MMKYLKDWAWINPHCNSLNSDWFERKFDHDDQNPQSYVTKYRCKDTFPVNRGEQWTVKQQGHPVEQWEVTEVDIKKNLWFEVEIREYLEDENAVY